MTATRTDPEITLTGTGRVVRLSEQRCARAIDLAGLNPARGLDLYQCARNLLDSDWVASLTAPDWPARAYIYGTWAYALNRAREHSTERNQKTYLYASTLDGETVWVVAWDPKR